jgi:hypothetical protein
VPYFTISSRVLPNNSYLSVDEVGHNITSGVLCHTDLINGSHDGRWYSYRRYRFLSYSPSYYQPLYAAQFEGGVALLLTTNSYSYNSVDGIYHCDIKTTESTNETTTEYESVYIGIYGSGGSLYLQSVTVEVLSTDPFQFAVICSTTGGPATSVIWTVDSEEVDGGFTVLNDGRNSGYISYLNATEEGVYNCTVRNSKPSVVTAVLDIAIPEPPSNFTVMQTLLNGVRLSWTAPLQRVDHYIIYYQLDSENARKMSSRVSYWATTHTVFGLERGESYLFSIVAMKNFIPSPEIGPLDITLVTHLNVSIIESDHEAPFYAGTLLNISCSINLPDAVDPQIIRDIHVKPSDYNSRSDTIAFTPLQESDAGVYYCWVCMVFQGRYSHRTVCERGEETPLVKVLELPTPEMRLVAADRATAGSEVSLECSVSLVPYLIVPPHVKLFRDEETFIAGEDTYDSLVHTLSCVRTWDAGQYVCKGALDIPEIYPDIHLEFQSSTHGLFVQLPRPSVSITASPHRNHFHGSSVTLTCEAVLSPSVDTFGSISLVWGGPRMIFSERAYTVEESGFGLRYSSSLKMTRLSKRDEGDYTCTVRVGGQGDILGSVVTKSFTLTLKHGHRGRLHYDE